MVEITNKKFFTNYAFFLLIIFVLFGLLIYPSIISRKSWTNNLRISVQKVLEEYEEGWQINEAINVNKPVTTSCAAYAVKNQKSGLEAKAIIIRVTTFYGPLPAVFIYKETDQKPEIIFAGYSTLHGRVKSQIDSSISDKRREYWEKKIPEIFN